MKILTIVGARPQFIKASSLSREIKNHNNIEEIIVHTGQHFDKNMSDLFFNQMNIPSPKYNLNINNGNHGEMTGKMIIELEKIILKENPDYIVLYGDTNSTLAGAISASKLNKKVIHIEAGLRSFNMKMPEEQNRILTDRISHLLFCPTTQAVKNLEEEGYKNLNCKIINSGDIMYDSAMYYKKKSTPPKNIDIPKEYILATIHRAENTNDIKKLNSIISALNKLNKEIDIILPLHPRTKNILQENNIKTNFKIIEPVGYLEMLYLLENSKFVMTDSGGLQKEAYFFKKNCIILREKTEWVELVKNNCNFIVGANENKILNIFKEILNVKSDFSKNIYGKENTSEIIIKNIIEDYEK